MSKEITIAVDDWTAEQLQRLSSWRDEHEDEITQRCLKHGVLDYEAALGDS